ncbi:MAG: hypothetical protein O3C63_00470 [Cyanobacteria bacterium]|nr:hypothetical protein [Cyanobacteriota bacterium]MDA1021346.1 hypothetical protein [Cyanobacteriota bacterium]
MIPKLQSANLAKSSGSSGTSTAKSSPTKTSKAETPSLDEKYFAVGIGYDILKTIPKILSGSFLATVLSNLLKDSKQTMDEIIYKTCMNDLPSRFLCDIVNTLAVRVFNGKTSFLGIKIPYLMPELSNQLFSIPSVLLARTVTQKFNVDKKSAKHNLSPEEEALRDEVMKQPFIKWVDKFSEFFHKNLKTKMDKIFSICLGVTSGTPIIDSEGNQILKKDGKALLSAPHVNYKWLGGVTGSTFLGSMLLLPKNTQAYGFDAVKSPLRGLSAILFTTFCRLNSTIITSATGIHTEGKNFDACLETAVQNRTFVPMVQYFCDAAAAILSYRVPFMNGATLAMIFRVFAEIPASFLTSGLMRIAKESRMTDEWSFLSHKLLKPFTQGMEDVTKPLLKFLTKNIYSKMPIPFAMESGIFNPNIKNMYDVDIQKHEHEARSEQDGGYLKALGLFVKKCFTLPAELYSLAEQGKASSAAKRAKLDQIVAAHEDKLEAKRNEKMLEAKLKEAGLDPQVVLHKSEKLNGQKIMDSKAVAV